MFAHGIMPLYTLLSGSWLNMAESIQRILRWRALEGQHPQTPAEIIALLEATVCGWNQDPTPLYGAESGRCFAPGVGSAIIDLAALGPCRPSATLTSHSDATMATKMSNDPLVDLIVLGFCSVLAGCDDFVEIAEWAKFNEVFFRSFLELPHGIPAHDTFTRVLAMLKPATLQEVLLPWLLERRGIPGVML